MTRVVIPVGGGGPGERDRRRAAPGGGRGRADRRAGERLRPLRPPAGPRRARRPSPPPRAGATIADGIAIKRPGDLTRAPAGRAARRDPHRRGGRDRRRDRDARRARQARRRGSRRGGPCGRAQRPPAATQRADGRDRLRVATSTAACCRPSCAAVRPRRAGAYALFTRVADRPGALAELLALVADAGANLLALEHLREAIPLHVRETGVALTLETRGPEHTQRLLEQPTRSRLRGRRAGSRARRSRPFSCQKPRPADRTPRHKGPWSGMVRLSLGRSRTAGEALLGERQGMEPGGPWGRSAKRRRKGGLRTQ